MENLGEMTSKEASNRKTLVQEFLELYSLIAGDSKDTQHKEEVIK